MLSKIKSKGTKAKYLSLGALIILIGGCATIPDAPSIMTLPGSGKTLEQFNLDEAQCRNYAFQAIGGDSANRSAEEANLKSAAIGTAVGAVAGAAIGGRDGAAVGAGTGLLFGTVVGADSGRRSGYSSQRAYDNAYIQCMYARGHKVPVTGTFTQTQPAQPGPAIPPPPPGSSTPTSKIPPPPVGTPPPPPPGVTP